MKRDDLESYIKKLQGHTMNGLSMDEPLPSQWEQTRHGGWHRCPVCRERLAQEAGERFSHNRRIPEGLQLLEGYLKGDDGIWVRPANRRNRITRREREVQRDFAIAVRSQNSKIQAVIQQGREPVSAEHAMPEQQQASAQDAGEADAQRAAQEAEQAAAMAAQKPALNVPGLIAQVDVARKAYAKAKRAAKPYATDEAEEVATATYSDVAKHIKKAKLAAEAGENSRALKWFNAALCAALTWQELIPTEEQAEAARLADSTEPVEPHTEPSASELHKVKRTVMDLQIDAVRAVVASLVSCRVCEIPNESRILQGMVAELETMRLVRPVAEVEARKAAMLERVAQVLAERAEHFERGGCDCPNCAPGPEPSGVGSGRDGSAPVVEVVTECPACKASYNDALQFCPECDEIHPEHAAKLSAMCDIDDVDPFEDDAPIELEECPELAPEDVAQIEAQVAAEAQARAAFLSGSAFLEIKREVNHDRREVLHGLVAAAGSDISNLYHSERGCSDAEAALLGYRATGWEDDRNVLRRAKEAKKRCTVGRKMEQARNTLRRGDCPDGDVEAYYKAPAKVSCSEGPEWAAQIDAQAVQVLEATTNAAHLLSADNALVMADPVAAPKPEPQVLAVGNSSPRPSFFARLKARAATLFSCPAAAPEAAPEPAAIEAQSEPIAVAAEAPESTPEAWARGLAAELMAAHPERAKKLGASLDFQLAQLATATDAQRWQVRAEAALRAKVA